jgi:hypothetical protein
MVIKAARQVCAGEGAGVAQEVGWGGRWEAQRRSHPMTSMGEVRAFVQPMHSVGHTR